MGTVSKPIALDESINTTESPSRNIADVLAQELGNLIVAVSRIAPQTTYDELNKLEDVNISAPSNGQVLKYNSVTQKWENGTGGGSGDTVSWSQIQQSGTKIAEIDINGTTTDVYAPSSSATITLVVTCDAVFQGEDLILTKGGTTLTQTVPAGLEVTFNVPSLGTWVLSNTYNADTESIDMNYYGQYAITLTGHTIPVGSTVTPTDDIQTLLNCADIWDKNYTTLGELLADTTTLQTVISSNNAIDYLVRSTTFATDMCADSTAMSYIGLNNYASNTLLANATWAGAIGGSTYYESVLNLKNPTMTSNNTPSGLCFASSYQSDRPPYKAFANGYWAPTSSDSGALVGYMFTQGVKIYRVNWRLIARGFSSSTLNATLQGSYNGSTYESVQSFQMTGLSTDSNVTNYPNGYALITPTSEFDYYRVNFGMKIFTDNLHYVIAGFDFYGRADV